MSSSTFSQSELGRFARTIIAVSPRRAVLCALITLGVTATEGIGLLLLVPLLQLVGIQSQAGPLAGIVGRFVAVFAMVGLRPTLGVVLIVYVAMIAFQSVLQQWQAIANAHLEHGVTSTLRARTYRAISGVGWTFFARNRAADFAKVLTQDVDRVGMAAYLLIDVFVSALTALVYVALALRVSPVITLFVAVCGLLLALINRGRLGSARAVGRKYTRATKRLNAAIAEQFASLKMAKSYGAEDRHARLFDELTNDVREASFEATRTHIRMRQPLTIGSAAVLALIVYTSYTVLAVSTAQLFLLLFLFARLVPRLTSVYEKSQTLATYLPAYGAVCDVEERCRAAAEPVILRHEPIDLAGQILFDSVTFSYDPETLPPAVRNVNLTIAAGETTAIVGVSGAGKSTLADLLLGLTTPTSGQIFVGGIALTPSRLASWRAQIGYVAQEPFLFHDTVRNNLLWAKPDATEADVREALRLAAADTFVAGLPQGIDTQVGDRGVLISGGERQRLSLARALVRRPKLLMLDEATSSLDSENEARIQESVEGLHQQVTIVIITHRLSTIRAADLIHVMDGGAVVESGTWHELLARPGGRFAELCRAQGIGDTSTSAERPPALAAAVQTDETAMIVSVARP